MLTYRKGIGDLYLEGPTFFLKKEMTNLVSFLTQHTFLNIGIISQIQPAKANIRYFLIKPLISSKNRITNIIMNNIQRLVIGDLTYRKVIGDYNHNFVVHLFNNLCVVHRNILLLLPLIILRDNIFSHDQYETNFLFSTHFIQDTIFHNQTIDMVLPIDNIVKREMTNFISKLDCDTQYEWYFHMTNATCFLQSKYMIFLNQTMDLVLQIDYMLSILTQLLKIERNHRKIEIGIGDVNVIGDYNHIFIGIILYFANTAHPSIQGTLFHYQTMDMVLLVDNIIKREMTNLWYFHITNATSFLFATNLEYITNTTIDLQNHRKIEITLNLATWGIVDVQSCFYNHIFVVHFSEYLTWMVNLTTSSHMTNATNFLFATYLVFLQIQSTQVSKILNFIIKQLIWYFQLIILRWYFHMTNASNFLFAKNLITTAVCPNTPCTALHLGGSARRLNSGVVTDESDLGEMAASDRRGEDKRMF
ncbi:hypothetical protein ACJX0J_025226 [Zea mays]